MGNLGHINNLHVDGILHSSTDINGNITGLGGPSGAVMTLQGTDQTRAFAPANKVRDPATYNSGTIGALIPAALSGATSTAIATDQPFSTISGRSFKITGNGSGTEAGDITVSMPLTTDNRWIGLWANRVCNLVNTQGAKPLPLSVYFTPDSFSTYSMQVVNLYPGLHFYVIPLPAASVSSPAWNNGSPMALPGTVTKIRMKLTSATAGTPTTFVDNTGATINNYAIAGEVIHIGDFYVDPEIPKAKFTIGFDDCKWDLVVPGGAAVVDGKGETKWHSYASFCASYGFPVNAFIISGGVGNYERGYMDWVSLARARDEYGVCYGAHSHVHPQQADVVGAVSNAGTRLLGQYGYGLVGAVAQTASATGLQFTPTQGHTGILTDIETCAEILNKKGFKEATKYYATPQGGTDIYVNQAAEKMGYKYIRHTTSQSSHPWATNSFTIAAGTHTYTPAAIAGSSIQTDGSNTKAIIEAYVDYIISIGGIGSNYAHSWAGSAACRQQTKWLCDYLKIKRDAGLIDVVSMAEL